MNTLFIPGEKELNDIHQMHILIFKTSIRFKKDIRSIAALLDEQPHVFKWNIDLADIDKVLRIESSINNATEIILLIREAGYFCEELPG